MHVCLVCYHTLLSATYFSRLCQWFAYILTDCITDVVTYGEEGLNGD